MDLMPLLSHCPTKGRKTFVKTEQMDEFQKGVRYLKKACSTVFKSPVTPKKLAMLRMYFSMVIITL